MEDLIAKYRGHPLYGDGYSDAFHGRGAELPESEAYMVGYGAGGRAVKLFSDHGMRRNGDAFEIGLAVR